MMERKHPVQKRVTELASNNSEIPKEDILDSMGRAEVLNWRAENPPEHKARYRWWQCSKTLPDKF